MTDFIFLFLLVTPPSIASFFAGVGWQRRRSDYEGGEIRLLQKQNAMLQVQKFDLILELNRLKGKR